MAFGKGKKKNVTGTQPTTRVDAPAEKPGAKSVKAGPARATGPKHQATRAARQRTTVSRKAGPKKTQSRTTTRSGDK